MPLLAAYPCELPVRAAVDLSPRRLGKHKWLRLSLRSSDKCSIVVSLASRGKPGRLCALDVKGCAYQVRQATPHGPCTCPPGHTEHIIV